MRATYSRCVNEKGMEPVQSQLTDVSNKMAGVWLVRCVREKENQKSMHHVIGHMYKKSITRCVKLINGCIRHSGRCQRENWLENCMESKSRCVEPSNRCGEQDDRSVE